MPKQEQRTEVSVVCAFWRKGRNSSGLKQRVSGEDASREGVS